MGKHHNTVKLEVSILVCHKQDTRKGGMIITVKLVLFSKLLFLVGLLLAYLLGGCGFYFYLGSSQQRVGLTLIRCCYIVLSARG